MINAAVKEAYEQLVSEHLNVLPDTYKTFIKGNGKKPYKLRIPSAQRDADEFADVLRGILSSMDTNHPALQALEKLSADLKLGMYVILDIVKNSSE